MKKGPLYQPTQENAGKAIQAKEESRPNEKPLWIVHKEEESIRQTLKGAISDA